MWQIAVGTAIASFILGVVVGYWRSHEWVARFRYEAEHWNKIVNDWRDAYQLQHQHARALRQEVVELNRRITALTIKECEVLEWVSKSVKKAREANVKLPESSTQLSFGLDSTTSKLKET